MDFYDLPEKNNIDKNETLFMMIFDIINKNKISFKTSITIFENFYINSNILIDMKSKIDEFRKEIDKLIGKIPVKDAVDSSFLLKKDSNYQKSKLLTEDKLNKLLSEYCDKNKIDIDIQNCMEHSRSIATALGNSLTTNALLAKTTNARTANDAMNTAVLGEAILGDLNPQNS